ncbi:hypothetical protein DMO16_01025 [Fictibacillus sp. S7]|nr:hypothetical protein DMO16_01025 [Fictibacillus sp. S7]
MDANGMSANQVCKQVEAKPEIEQ